MPIFIAVAQLLLLIVSLWTFHLTLVEPIYNLMLKKLWLFFISSAWKPKTGMKSHSNHSSHNHSNSNSTSNTSSTTTTTGTTTTTAGSTNTTTTTSGSNTSGSSGNHKYNVRIEDGKLFYEKRWFHRGQNVYVESKDMGKVSAIITSIGQIEVRLYDIIQMLTKTVKKLKKIGGLLSDLFFQVIIFSWSHSAEVKIKQYNAKKLIDKLINLIMTKYLWHFLQKNGFQTLFCGKY